MVFKNLFLLFLSNIIVFSGRSSSFNGRRSNVQSAVESQTKVKAQTIPEGYQLIDGYTQGTGIDSIYTSSEYPFTYETETKVFTSGNAFVNSSFSELMITVKGSGSLFFSYECLNVTTLSDQDYFKVNIGSTINTSNDVTFKTRCVDSYQSYNLKIDAESDTTETKIFVGYKKNGSKSYGLDIVKICGIAFLDENQKVSIDVKSSNSNYGSVVGGGSYFINEIVNIEAIPTNVGKFYCWQLNGEKTEYTQKYSFPAYNNITLIAIFGPTDGIVAENVKSGKVYTSLEDGIEEMLANEAIMIRDGATIARSVTLKKNTTLYVPYSEEFDQDGTNDGDKTCSQIFAKEDKAFSTLIIDDGAILSIEGTLLIGGVIGYPNMTSYQGHTSGAYGRIINNGTINVLNNGTISCYGFINGSGVVKANGGDVYEPFVVLDFSGGNNSADLFFIDQSSFCQYTMANISCKLIITSSSHLYGYCNLYASGEYNKTQATIVGPQQEESKTLFCLYDGSYLVRSFDDSRSISGATSKTKEYGSDIFRATYHVYGGGSLNNLNMPVMGFDICVLNFPIPYSLNIVIEQGEYNLRAGKGWTVFPGSKVLVKNDATLNVYGNLYVLDGLYSTGMSGKYYPNSTDLSSNGFSTNGALIINGKLNLMAGSNFGGIVQTESLTSEINVDINANVSNPDLQIGGTACYDDNTNTFDLNGRINTKNGLIEMKAGSKYVSKSTEEWILESYTIKKYVVSESSTIPTSGEYGKPSSGNYHIYGGPKVITTNQTMVGYFIDYESIVDGVTFNELTFLDSSDTTRAKVTNINFSNNTLTFSVSSTVDGTKYLHIVEYKKGNSEYVYILPINGVYTITNVNEETNVKITSGLIGDVDLDGYFTATDLTLIKKHLKDSAHSPNSIKCIKLADINYDGQISSQDIEDLAKILVN